MSPSGKNLNKKVDLPISSFVTKSGFSAPYAIFSRIVDENKIGSWVTVPI